MPVTLSHATPTIPTRSLKADSLACDTLSIETVHRITAVVVYSMTMKSTNTCHLYHTFGTQPLMITTTTTAVK